MTLYDAGEALFDQAPDFDLPDGRRSARSDADSPDSPVAETLSRPFRLGLVGLGIAVGLFLRMAVSALSISDLTNSRVMLGVAACSGLAGLGLTLMAEERDRLGAPVRWIVAVTALSWGCLYWISPPFDESVTVWNDADQTVLAVVGVGNGLLLAGLICLGLVRRGPTLSVAATLVAGVLTLAANTVLLRVEWPSILALAFAFALVLLAWDRSPRRERLYVAPADSPRSARMALSFLSVALCGVALQMWQSRDAVPRATPAVILAVLLVIAAFASIVRVRREIQRRETTLSEWTSWMSEIRTNKFRSEIENFDSSWDEGDLDLDIERPTLSFPDLAFGDSDPLAPPAADAASTIATASPKPVAQPAAQPAGASSSTSQHRPAVQAPEPALSLPTETPVQAQPAPAPDPVAAAAPGPAPTPKPAPAPAAIARPGAGALPRIVLPTADAPDLPTPDVARSSRGTAAAASAPPSEPTTTKEAGGAFSFLVSDDPEPVGAPVADTVPGTATKPSADINPIAEPATPIVEAAPSEPDTTLRVVDLAALDRWLIAGKTSDRRRPLLVAIEAMTLNEFESLPPEDSAMARDEIGGYLADTLPDASLVAWIDGPYFIVAYDDKPVTELGALNTEVQKMLKSTNGALAYVRPGTEATLDEVVDESVTGLLTARKNMSA